MDTAAHRGGTVGTSDSYERWNQAPGGWATGTLSHASTTHLAAPAAADPPLRHTKMPGTPDAPPNPRTYLQRVTDRIDPPLTFLKINRHHCAGAVNLVDEEREIADLCV
ncbi:jg14492 [Pararge aegeria aegeria]|uniref:Jg14492 protein n=1 Tax=Pararge aegeria aegeria TaxID=348720 RepID=A0A8S4S031_9NEOP|nr:jg14492 [Pararge aegeria aegeria]